MTITILQSIYIIQVKKADTEIDSMYGCWGQQW